MAERYRKEIRTSCPVCARDLNGTEYEEGGRIYLTKTCPEHGKVNDLVSSDARVYLDKMGSRLRTYHDNCTLHVCSQGVCPHHLTREAEWAFIEVTMRCNMKCPVCYADSDSRGEDVPIDDIKKIIDHIADENVVREMLLAGGEATVREDLFEILDYIKEKGLMKKTYLVSNGIKLADPEYCRRLRETGLKRIELAFDSTDPEICRKIRGSLAAYDALPKALENLRKLGRVKVQLTITVVKGLNDRTLKESLEFALENSDIVKHVVISPQQFCGRLVQRENLAEKRLTLECVEKLLREGLGDRLYTISVEAGLSLVEPLRRMGIMNIDKEFPICLHPKCASFGFIGRTWSGKLYSLFDSALKPGINPYDIRNWANKLSDRIKAQRSRTGKRFGTGAIAKLARGTRVYLCYLPQYLCKLLVCTRPRFWLRLAVGPFRKLFRRVRWRDAMYGPQFLHLYIIFLGDEFNFSWERLPYCYGFQYMIHPQTGKVTKVPACLFISHRKKVINIQRAQ
ncbi:MAG: radical SAM protein [Candidatus Tritonobacter lacicola]|nr:radical SAM protein [Candidatus Tritonobacter lacicola]